MPDPHIGSGKRNAEQGIQQRIDITNMGEHNGKEPTIDFKEPESLYEQGWYLRSDIIWKKSNPMPESCTDRPTKAHEYVFLMSKQARYYYDADSIREKGGVNTHSKGKKLDPPIDNAGIGHKEWHKYTPEILPNRNRRTVWTIPTQPFPNAHFATFPTALVIPCIKAGTSEKGNCSICGKPWVRVVNRPKPPDGAYDKAHISNDENVKLSPAYRGKKASGQKMQNWINKHPSKTIGWQPSCTCISPDEIKKHWEKQRFMEKRSHWKENIWHDEPPTVKPIVLDPFMGSGTVAEVCERYGRAWIGIELSKEYCDIAVKRIEKEACQLKFV